MDLKSAGIIEMPQMARVNFFESDKSTEKFFIKILANVVAKQTGIYSMNC
jgi:hypothetical protein